MISLGKSFKSFSELPTDHIFELIYPKKLSMSLLLNGTRRWYVAEYLDSLPTDNSYFADYLVKVLDHLARLLETLTSHGLYRLFLPVYSWYQPSRNPVAHHFLLKGIEALVTYPALLDVYERQNIQVRFYGDTTHFPSELQACIAQATVKREKAHHHLYFGVDGGNPYEYSLQLAHAFSEQHGRAARWDDLLELYYGDRTLSRLDILVAFNRIYSRGGIPHLLEGGDRIYATAITPLVLSEISLRAILFDHLFNVQEQGRDYRYIHPNEIRRLKEFYTANRDTVIGLVRKYEDLVYPMPTIQWPENMNK